MFLHAERESHGEQADSTLNCKTLTATRHNAERHRDLDGALLGDDFLADLNSTGFDALLLGAQFLFTHL